MCWSLRAPKDSAAEIWVISELQHTHTSEVGSALAFRSRHITCMRQTLSYYSPLKLHLHFSVPAKRAAPIHGKSKNIHINISYANCAIEKYRNPHLVPQRR